jgi:hypothetical protein
VDFAQSGSGSAARAVGNMICCQAMAAVGEWRPLSPQGQQCNNASIMQMQSSLSTAFPVHLQAMTKVAASASLASLASARCCMWQSPIVEFQHVDRVVRDPPPPRWPGPLFRRDADDKVMAGSAARVAPLICLKYFLRAALRCKPAGLKPPSRP